MNREEKAAAVEELSGRLGESSAVFAVDYRGISVSEAYELRTQLHESDAVFSVVKNRLAKLAAERAGTEGLDDVLVGPTALTLIKGDPVLAAKTISNFAKENEALKFKGGIMDGAFVDADGFQALAKLPGVDILRGQLVGLAASPITGLARGLGAMISGLAIALGQVAEQGLVGGTAEAAPAPEPEPEAEAEAPAAEAAEAEAAEADPDAAPAEPEAAEAAETEAEAADAEPEAEAEPAEEAVEAAEAETESEETTEDSADEAAEADSENQENE